MFLGAVQSISGPERLVLLVATKAENFLMLPGGAPLSQSGRHYSKLQVFNRDVTSVFPLSSLNFWLSLSTSLCAA